MLEKVYILPWVMVTKVGIYEKLHPAPPSVVPLLYILISYFYRIFFKSPQKCCHHISTSLSKQELLLRPNPVHFLQLTLLGISCGAETQVFGGPAV